MSEYPARPDNLVAFGPVSSSLDTDIVSAKSMLASDHGSFRANNRWGDVDASALLEGIEQFVMLNKGDATWVAEVGEAFRAADASGDVAHASSIMVAVKPSEHQGSRGAMDSDSILAAKLNEIYKENREKALAIAERLEIEEYHLDLHIKELKRNYKNGLKPQGPWTFDADIANRELQLRTLAARSETFRAFADPDRNFLQITDDPQPRVSEVHGNLAAADNVTFIFPGTGTTADSFKAGGRKDPKTLLTAQREVDKGRTHAVIDSLSYEAPTGIEKNPLDMMHDFASDEFLDRASEEIGMFVESVPMQEGATRNAYGHSYGSTGLAKSTLDNGLPWDNIVAAGSPGMVADHADEFGAGDVIMVANDGDPITGLGKYDGGLGGSLISRWGDPYSPEFGAQQKGDYNPGPISNMDPHSEYLVLNSEITLEIAKATTDKE